jgi:hypothetical protein
LQIHSLLVLQLAQLPKVKAKIHRLPKINQPPRINRAKVRMLLNQQMHRLLQIRLYDA